MEKIGIFFGSTTGQTEEVAGKIGALLGDNADVINIADVRTKDILSYSNIILGTSTWGLGELQGDWINIISEFEALDFSGKNVAFFGLGDQIGFSGNFVDGMGELFNIVKNNGGNCIGSWDTDGYDFEGSAAKIDDFTFVGLAVDQNNQPELTDDRVSSWVKDIEAVFG